MQVRIKFRACSIVLKFPGAPTETATSSVTKCHRVQTMGLDWQDAGSLEITGGREQLRNRTEMAHKRSANIECAVALDNRPWRNPEAREKKLGQADPCSLPCWFMACSTWSRQTDPACRPPVTWAFRHTAAGARPEGDWSRCRACRCGDTSCASLSG